MGAKGSGGRNRKSAAQKAAEGNRGRRPLDLRPPVALPGEPPMPTWLTAAARALWPEVCAIIQATGVLYATDGMAVAALCSSLAMFRQAEEELVGKHLTWEAVDQLGNIAVRFSGQKLDWDASKLVFPNSSAATRLVSKEYRKGWDFVVSAS